MLSGDACSAQRVAQCGYNLDVRDASTKEPPVMRTQFFEVLCAVRGQKYYGLDHRVKCRQSHTVITLLGRARIRTR